MYLKMPNNYVLWLDGNNDYEGRLKIVNDLIFNYNNSQWSTWFEKMWLNERSSFGQSMNITENILDRIGTFLLQGNFRDGNILTSDKTEVIRMTEIPVSSTEGSNIEDYIYSSTSFMDDMTGAVNVSSKLSDGQIVKNVYDMKNKDIEKEKKRKEKAQKKWKESKTYRLNALYTTKKLDTYRVITKGKDLQGKPMFYTEPVHIGQDGIINGACVSKWATVDTLNEFEFMNSRYRISNDVEAYKVGEDNKASQEKILIFFLPETSTYLYFDESIQPISENQIIKL